MGFTGADRGEAGGGTDLQDTDYDGLVSVEAYAKEPEQALKRAVFLREYF